MSEKIKVLRIIGQCKSGGTESIALNYYKNIDHSKIAMDFMFYGNSLPRFEEELTQYGDQVINITDYTDNLVKSIFEIKRIVKSEQYDIVHSQLNTLNVFPLLGALLGGAKIRIAANHSTANLKYETRKTIFKYLFRPSVKFFATHYAACSIHAGEWCFGKKAIKKNRVKVIRNAIDLDRFEFKEKIRDSIRKENGWDNKFVIGHAGRFTEQKNHMFMVDIFSRLSDRNPDAIMVFIGEGHLMQQVKNYVDSLYLSDKVFFLGTRFDVEELMQGMDLFLFPSLYEGLGNVITEAQAVGLMSVVSDVIPKEVIMTDLVECVGLNDTVEKWVEVLLKYKNGYRRCDTHKILSQQGYNINDAAKDLEEYYYSLIEKN